MLAFVAKYLEVIEEAACSIDILTAKHT